jgi:hypothetical protein
MNTFNQQKVVAQVPLNRNAESTEDFLEASGGNGKRISRACIPVP